MPRSTACQRIEGQGKELNDAEWILSRRLAEFLCQARGWNFRIRYLLPRRRLYTSTSSSLPFAPWDPFKRMT